MFTATITSQPADVTDVAAVRYTCACAGCGGAGGNAVQHTAGPISAATSQAVSLAAQGTAGDAAALLAGSQWADASAGARTVITYSFIDAGSTYSAAAAPWQASASPLSEADRATTREVLANIEAVCGVTFVEVADSGATQGVLRYGYSQRPNDLGYAGYAFYPSPAEIGGDIWIGKAQAGVEWDHYRPGLILHETLHALGLKHPFDGGTTLSAQDDIIPNTVMSYSPVAGNRSGAMSHYPTQPMPLDIQALRTLYGASTHNAADTVHDAAALQGNFHIVVDSGGTDTLSCASLANAVRIDLAPGAASTIGLTVHAFAYSGSGAGRTVSHSTYEETLRIDADTWIENATGSAYDDVLTGNGLANLLQGGAGDDRLTGLGGNDLLVGGTGLDTALYQGRKANFQVERSADGFRVADLGGAQGTDLLQGVERLAFTDRHVALDLDGNAGLAAKILSAVMGTAAIHNASYLGRVISLLDSGRSASQVADHVVDAALGVPHTHESFVALLYANVTGALPDNTDLDYYTRLLDTGMASQSSLTLLAAQGGANLARIDLVGLGAHGLEYVPYA
ncbi:MAG: hypothetical protein AB7P37_01430 [Ramlibacter sp.]